MLNLDAFWDDLVGRSGGGTIYGVVGNLQGDVQSLVVVIAIIYIGYKVMLYLSDVNSKLDPFVIIRPVLVVAAVGLYRDLVDLLLLTPMFIVDEMVSNGFNVLGAEPARETLFNTGMSYVYPGTAGIPGVYDIIAINPFLEVLHLVIYFAATAVGFYILLRQVVIASIYYVIGILALPFSLIVGNQSVLGSWFFGFISILLWGPILHIMKGIIVALNVENFNVVTIQGLAGVPNGILSVALQVVMILTILQIPKYANALVSKGSELGSGLGDSISRGMRKKAGLM
ncbi:hypothetical protein [Ascidiimonas sp. W6]|uniref:hypothetical protein n=1 Tax=Ascidiimonas meishanensis TaxID=3128903 RepID=UPI0030EE2CBE